MAQRVALGMEGEYQYCAPTKTLPVDTREGAKMRTEIYVRCKSARTSEIL